MNTEGFTLVEMLVYASLSFFFVAIVVRFLSTYEIAACRQSQRAVFEASCNAGLDSCARACAAAPADARRWTHLQPDYIAWKKDAGQEGFLLRNSTLVKVYRSVNAEGPAYSTLMQHVQGSFFVDQAQGLVRSIRISLMANLNGQAMMLQRLIYLHEGLV